MPTYRVINLGCKVNRVEADDFERALCAAGVHAAAPDTPADIVVVNTCTVTGEAEKKTRKSIRQALAANPGAQVYVTGCAAAIDARNLKAIDTRVQIITKPRLEALLQEQAYKKPGEGEGEGEGFAQVAAPHIRERAGLKIQDGCDNACTYCIVCKARGASYSVPASRVLSRACELARAGHREIVLSGINLGAYNASDLHLPQLLERLLAQTADIVDDANPYDIYPARFRISSIEPGSITHGLLELLASQNGRVCRHLHIPLQSGSSRVLREMARNYSAEEYISLIEDIRAYVPQIALSTDIIVGFPGETQADFEQTLSVARACGFAKIHAFPYSRRENTPAAARLDQVDPDTKKARMQALSALGRELRAQDEARRKDTRELFCIQDNSRATSESYYERDLRALCPTFKATPEQVGKLVPFCM